MLPEAGPRHCPAGTGQGRPRCRFRYRPRKNGFPVTSLAARGGRIDRIRAVQSSPRNLFLPTGRHSIAGGEHPKDNESPSSIPENRDSRSVKGFGGRIRLGPRRDLFAPIGRRRYPVAVGLSGFRHKHPAQRVTGAERTLHPGFLNGHSHPAPREQQGLRALSPPALTTPGNRHRGENTPHAQYRTAGAAGGQRLE